MGRDGANDLKHYGDACRRLIPLPPHRRDGGAVVDAVGLLPSAPGGASRDAIEAAIRDWIEHPAFRELTRLCGWPELSADHLAGRLEQLDRCSASWDFREGRPRNQVHVVTLDEDLDQRVLEAARLLGLRGMFERPRGTRYDHCLILGGLVRACLLRPAWAARLAASGVDFGRVTALGAFRPFRGDEFDLAREAGLDDVSDEHGAMDAGMRRAFGLIEQPMVHGQLVSDDTTRSWSVRSYQREGAQLDVVAAPSGEPGRPANTAETYAWWGQEVAELSPSQRVLLVTTSIYVPYQHADAIRMLSLEYGCAVETVGVPYGFRDGITPQRFDAQHYLQEMRSTIRAYRALLAQIRPDAF